MCTTGGMERELRKRGISGDTYRMWTGGQSFRQFIEANSRWRLRQFTTLLDENFINGSFVVGACS